MKQEIFLILICLISSISCERETDVYDYYKENPGKISELIRFTEITPDTLPADQASKARITVQIHPRADSAFRKVEFSSNESIFEGNSNSIEVLVNTAGFATTEITSTSYVGGVRIEAKVRDIFIDTSIYFDTSYPEDALLKASTIRVDSGSSSKLTLRCYRFQGRVTDNLRTRFYVPRDDTSKAYPFVDPYGIIRNDSLTVVITNPYRAMGHYPIIARVPLSKNDSLERRIDLFFK